MSEAGSECKQVSPEKAGPRREKVLKEQRPKELGIGVIRNQIGRPAAVRCACGDSMRPLW